MDPISLGIIVTSVVLSAVLLLILYSFHGERKPLESGNIGTGSTKSLSSADNKQTTSSKLVDNQSGSNKSTTGTSSRSSNGVVKQVHFSDTVQVKTTDVVSKIKQNGHAGATKNSSKQDKNSKKAKQHNNSSGSNTNENNNNEISTQNKNTQHAVQADSTKINSNEERQEIELAADKLDPSVMSDTCNQIKTSLNLKSSMSSGAYDHVKKTPRRRQNSDQASYSSEKLFSMIAASNLSQDEIQLAIDSLLNKLDSAEAEWRQPKNDPIQRLKNQLRDAESNLATETQNHVQTRARLNELKAEVQNEKVAKSQINEELTKLRKEFTVALDKVQLDLVQQKSIQDSIRCESSKMIAKLEQDNVQLQTMLAGKTSVHGDELSKLHNELKDRQNQLDCYELANQNLSSKVQELESGLHNAEMKLDQFMTQKRHDDYEACAKITELESERHRLDKALNDHVKRLKELTETNNLLEKSVNELQIMNGRQDEMLKRMHDERHINESSMKRTLCEMEQELRELQAKLSSKSSAQDERLREEINQFERELNDADQREQKLAARMTQLRQGLSELFPDLLRSSEIDQQAEDWVHQYLVALRQLAQTVDELRYSNDRNNNDSPISPSKTSNRSISTFTQTNGSSMRVGSPSSSSRPSSRATNHSGGDHEKRIMETKLVELNDEIKLRETLSERLSDTGSDTDFEGLKQDYEHQIKDLAQERDKLKAQIKIGIDAFRMERKRVQELEEELAKYVQSAGVV